VARFGTDHPGPVEFLADGVIEARPETLLAFREEATRLGLDARVRWVPGLAQIAQFNTSDPDAPWLVLRHDGLGDETGGFGPWETVHRAGVHKFVFEWRRPVKPGS
jgi:hypothetical protein